MNFKTSKLNRFLHLIFGHNFTTSTEITRETFENHPHSDKDFIYTVVIRKCECGLLFQDCGLEFRDKTWFQKQ